jgi:NADH:ubiquinone oxidoreductase subunit 6 (subunit J)
MIENPVKKLFTIFVLLKFELLPIKIIVVHVMAILRKFLFLVSVAIFADKSVRRQRIIQVKFGLIW